MQPQLGDSFQQEPPRQNYQPRNSPKKQASPENHARPSNMFDPITEAEFNAKEEAKNAYRRELQQQMEEAKRKKDMARQKQKDEELMQDKKIYNQLHQMQNEFIQEETKKGN